MKTLCLLYADTQQKDEQTDVWKQAQCVEAEAVQKCKQPTLNSLAAVIHENKRNAVGNSEKIAHSLPRSYILPAGFN